MNPELFAAFVTAFTEEWNGCQASRLSRPGAKRVEIERIKQAIGRLVDAITEGTPAFWDKGSAYRSGRRVPRRWRRHSPQQLPSSRLHSNPAEFYRVKVVGLVETLQRENDAAAREQTRGLVRRFI
jgi:hypothetical protein